MSGIQYIVLANLNLILLLGFYLLFLKKETFFQLNRAYLLVSLLVAFIMPRIQTTWISHLNITQQIKYSFQSQPITIFADQSAVKDHFTWGATIFDAYLLGVVVSLVILLVKLWAVKRMIANNGSAFSYSFFKKIHLGRTSMSPLIYQHEHIHASQWHSADIILMEIVVALNWFNPAVYFYRKELKNVHEFIADEGALRVAGSKKEYALLLFSQTFETPNKLVNTFFNQTLLKQRIMMIQKNKSQKSAMLKYLLAAPLFMLMLILSSATIDRAVNSKALNQPESISAQPQTGSDKVFYAVEQPPAFPGGLAKLYAFLQQNIKYPAEMRQRKVEGKVFISFIVEADGSLSHLKVLREPGYGSGAEARRVLSLSPKWIAGIQNGHKVRVQYTMPISFTLKA